MTLTIAPGVRCAPPQLLSGAGDADGAEPIDAAVLQRPVLIVEDEGVIAWTLQTMLEDMGFEQICVAASGPDAIQEAQRRQPSLIISDINLGDGKMSGVAACIEISRSGTPQIIFVTGFASADDRLTIETELPSASLLRKPIAEADLLHAIKSTINPLH